MLEIKLDRIAKIVIDATKDFRQLKKKGWTVEMHYQSSPISSDDDLGVMCGYRDFFPPKRPLFVNVDFSCASVKCEKK